MFKSVMIIDDSEMDRFISEKVIKKLNVSEQVLSFSSAEEGLDYILSVPQKLPEVIFLDINMPGISGFDFLIMLQLLPKPIPQQCRVVMLSSSLDPEDIHKAKTFPQVVHYLHKPISKEMITYLMGIL